MAPIHATLAAGRWQQLTFAQQLGNIGSEFLRCRQARARGSAAVEACAFRLLELLDLSLEDRRWRGRRKELVRLREVFCDWWQQTGVYAVTAAELESYLSAFARRARTISPK